MTEGAAVLAPPHRPSPHKPRPVLTQIQALRAIAVLIVCAYHLKPDTVPGGFVGVDVFFVISGFLMTRHLMRTSSASFGTKLWDFYTRRIRRILPASLFVLTLVALYTLAFVARSQWHLYFGDIRASALYAQNWHLISTATDYLAAHSSSPVQHYWSLSVEEQFYLVWPALILTIVAFRKRPWALVIGILAVSIASFALSQYQVSSANAGAYFNSFGRVWEFGIGGLAAVVPAKAVQKYPRALSAVLCWGGLAVIAGVTLRYSANTPFPGVHAVVPCVAAVAIILSGSSSTWFGPHRILAIKPVQFIGDISYSLYLWHFPLITFWLLKHPNGITLRSAALLMIAAVVLAAATKILVEDPFRSRRWVEGRGTMTWALPVVLVALAVIPSGIAQAGLAKVDPQIAAATKTYDRVIANPPSCFGAETEHDVKPGCTSASVDLAKLAPDPLIPTIGFAEGCQQAALIDSIKNCRFGSSAQNATPVALVGDSHATQWVPALSSTAVRQDWHVTTYLKSGCALTVDGGATPSCASWGRNVLAALAHQSYKYVFVAARSTFGSESSPSFIRTRVAGLARAWRAIGEDRATVVALRDIPQPANAGVVSIPDCVEEAHPPYDSCDFNESRALDGDEIAVAARQVPGVRLVDLTSYFCTSGQCHAVVGNVLVYVDDNHMTQLFSLSLTDALVQSLQSLHVL